MITTKRIAGIIGLLTVLTTGFASAAGWQEQLGNAAAQLTQQNSGATGNNGLSLSTLTGLLNGGNSAVSAGNMSNAAGILQYCFQNNVVKNNVTSLKDQVLDKLGLNTKTEQTQQTDYQQGLMGLLNTGNGQQLNLKTLGNTQIGQKLKTKACDVVLNQAKRFIS